MQFTYKVYNIPFMIKAFDRTFEKTTLCSPGPWGLLVPWTSPQSSLCSLRWTATGSTRPLRTSDHYSRPWRLLALSTVVRDAVKFDFWRTDHLLYPLWANDQIWSEYFFLLKRLAKKGKGPFPIFIFSLNKNSYLEPNPANRTPDLCTQFQYHTILPEVHFFLIIMIKDVTLM